MRAPLTIFVLATSVLVACGGGASSSPTAPTATPPPVAVTPPPTTPPPPPVTPTITNFAGTWRGNYVIERCSGQGTIEDVLCSAPSGSRPGGIYPVGTVLQLAIALNQSGTTVTGTIAFGEVTGPVTGTITNDRLVLRGRATSTEGLSLDISAWDTGIASDQLTGTLTYSAEVRGFPGFAAVTSRLSGVRR